jgi:hypothetical protein
MTRLFSVLMAMFGMLVAGCAHDQAAGLRGFSWHYLQTAEEGAKLAYGVADSDDVAAMFTCAPGSGQVRLEVHGDAPGGLILSSQGVTARLDATAVEGMPGGGAPLMSTNLPADDNTLSRFAVTGRLLLVAGGHSAPLDTTGIDRGDVGRFFAACRRTA